MKGEILSIIELALYIFLIVAVVVSIKIIVDTRRYYYREYLQRKGRKK